MINFGTSLSEEIKKWMRSLIKVEITHVSKSKFLNGVCVKSSYFWDRSDRRQNCLERDAANEFQSESVNGNGVDNRLVQKRPKVNSVRVQ